jgi:hypothetical protein
MNYLKIYFFIFYVLLETTIFPGNLEKIVPGKSLYFIVLLNGAFMSLLSLKKFNKFKVISFALFDLYIFYEILRRNYVSELKISDLFYVFLLFAFFLIIFASLNKNEDLKEFGTSSFLNLLFSLVGNVCFSHGLLSHFKSNHMGKMREYDNFEKINYETILISFLADFLIFSNFVIFMFLTKAFYSKSKKSHYIMQVIKKVLLFVVYVALFYANYNTALSDFIYKKFNEYVPKPHNIVVYNCMPLNPDIRFRLIVVSLLNIFS